MPDLRTRIIAVLYDHGDMPSDKAARLADAVISELGLQRLEAGTWADGLSFHRYITNWIPNAD